MFEIFKKYGDIDSVWIKTYITTKVNINFELTQTFDSKVLTISKNYSLFKFFLSNSRRISESLPLLEYDKNWLRHNLWSAFGV